MNVLVYLNKKRKRYRVVAFAVSLAKYLNVDLTLLYVLKRGEDQAVGNEILQQAKEQAGEIDVETLLRWGDPAGVLLSEAHQAKYDLIIMRVGPKLRGIPRLVPLDKIISQSTFPSVLVFKKECPTLKNMLICTSGGTTKSEAITVGAKLAQAVSANVTLLHVVSGAVPSMFTGLDEIEETLDELLQTDTPIAQHLRAGAEILERHNIEGELELRRGIPIEEIVREVHLGSYDMLVIGRSRVSKGWKEFILGDVMQQILTQVMIPVLVVGESGMGDF